MRMTLCCALTASALVVAACGSDENKNEGSNAGAPAPAAAKAFTVEVEGQKAQFNIPSDHRPKPSPAQEGVVTFVPPGCGGGQAKLTVFTTKEVSTPDQVIEFVKGGQATSDVGEQIGEPKPILGDGGQAATVAHFKVPGYDAVRTIAVVQAAAKTYPAVEMTHDVKPGCDAERIIAEHEKVLQASKVPFSG